MAQTKKEASRLVYLEGLSLDSALEMSAKYRNIIFLTDDNKKSHELTDSEKEIDETIVAQQEHENVNDDWDLGLNIVRNGHKYIVVRGINNQHCTFTADGTKYTLRIDQHGLLYLDTNEVSERFIYIGSKAVKSDKFIYNIEEIKDAFQGVSEFPSYVRQHYVISQNVKTIGTKTEITNFVYLAIVQNQDAINEYGYIWLFSDKATLKEATDYKDIGTIIGPHANENRLGWRQNEDQETGDTVITTSSPVSTDIDAMDAYDNEFSINTVFGIDMDDNFWGNSQNQQLYILVPETYENSILITNTLSSNRDGSDETGIMNNSLQFAFRLEKKYTREENVPIIVDYNRARYHEYTFDYNVRTVAFTVE
jgi:hypothetical protein